MKKLKVVIAGAAGKMGMEILRTCVATEDIEVVGALDLYHVGEDAGILAGITPLGVLISDSLTKVLEETKPDVLVDFTVAESAYKNVIISLRSRVAVVVGTTGFAESELAEFKQICKVNKIACLYATNFAIGAILMLKFAEEAAKYIQDVEIIELHHDNKMDAPSGTAVTTAELIAKNRAKHSQGKAGEIEKLNGARGADYQGMHLHSVRLPGLLAHQEVLFGAKGQLLTIRHDAYSREAYMPGIALAIRKIGAYDGFLEGLESIMD